MFFIASKVGWFLLAPSTLLFLIPTTGVALAVWTRFKTLGLRLALGGLIALALVVILPVGDWLLRPLEQRFPPYQPCAARPIAGVLLLGGGLGTHIVAGRPEEDLNSGADRMREAAALARINPDRPVLISGGQVFPKPGQRSEAEGMADLLVELGVDRARLRLESGSRTTAENADFAKSQTTGSGAWLLVTSAYHMPRAIGTFRKAGVPVIAAPTDWQVDDNAPLLLVSAADRLGRLDLATREYLGLIAYSVAGRTDALLPGPQKNDACPG